jgi:hypothetical protein
VEAHCTRRSPTANLTGLLTRWVILAPPPAAAALLDAPQVARLIFVFLFMWEKKWLQLNLNQTLGECGPLLLGMLPKPAVVQRSQHTCYSLELCFMVGALLQALSPANLGFGHSDKRRLESEPMLRVLLLYIYIYTCPQPPASPTITTTNNP